MGVTVMTIAVTRASIAVVVVATTTMMTMMIVVRIAAVISGTPGTHVIPATTAMIGVRSRPEADRKTTSRRVTTIRRMMTSYSILSFVSFEGD